LEIAKVFSELSLVSKGDKLSHLASHLLPIVHWHLANGRALCCGALRRS
jgi:hypothetical protein